MAPYKPLQDRLRDGYSVDPVSGCWEWKRGKDTWGYGQIGIQVDGRTKQLQAHRVSYELHVGKIPDGLELDHLCRNRACVNHSHLEPVTTRINVLRSLGPAAINAQKTHCHHGHPFDEINTGTHRGKRFCRECRRKQDRERKIELRKRNVA